MEQKQSIEDCLAKRVNTHYGIYSDIGSVLDQFTTQELVDYYLKRYESRLRFYIESEIIADEINKLKYMKG